MRIYQIFILLWHWLYNVRSRQWINKDCVNFIAIKMYRNVVLGCKKEKERKTFLPSFIVYSTYSRIRNTVIIRYVTEVNELYGKSQVTGSNLVLYIYKDIQVKLHFIQKSNESI